MSRDVIGPAVVGICDLLKTGSLTGRGVPDICRESRFYTLAALRPEAVNGTITRAASLVADNGIVLRSPCINAFAYAQTDS